MKERPILFSAPMVRAILQGKKTQTRRIVKPQPELAEGAWYWCHPRYNNGIGVQYFHTNAESAAEKMATVCPYGVAGDRLWVRETWFDNVASDDGDEAKTPARCVYRADGEFIEQFPEEYMEGRWSPSIHMPRWASRITLVVVAVRVERLQDITNNDAIEEGCDGERWLDSDGSEGRGVEPWEQFRDLWHKINGPESWSANPWVWVVEFRKLEGGAT